MNHAQLLVAMEFLEVDPQRRAFQAFLSGEQLVHRKQEMIILPATIPPLHRTRRTGLGTPREEHAIARRQHGKRIAGVLWNNPEAAARRIVVRLGRTHPRSEEHTS